MGTRDWFALVAVLFVPMGGTWGVVKVLLLRDRRRVAEDYRNLEVEHKALRADLNNALIELGRLEERIQSMPDHKALQERLERLEDRLERKLDGWAEALQKSLDRAILAMGGGAA